MYLSPDRRQIGELPGVELSRTAQTLTLTGKVRDRCQNRPYGLDRVDNVIYQRSTYKWHQHVIVHLALWLCLPCRIFSSIIRFLGSYRSWSFYPSNDSTIPYFLHDWLSPLLPDDSDRLSRLDLSFRSYRLDGSLSPLRPTLSISFSVDVGIRIGGAYLRTCSGVVGSYVCALHARWLSVIDVSGPSEFIGFKIYWNSLAYIFLIPCS